MKASISRIKCFKACRRLYELKYIEGLEPVEKSEALKTGSSYHEYIENLYKTGELPTDDFSKECAMAHAYKKFVYPQLKVESAEKWLELDTAAHTIIGRVDGITPDGKIVEHKTTSLSPMEYVEALELDEQLLAYMALTGAREILYTVITKPTIRLKKGETEEEYFERVIDWYDETKIGVVPVYRSDDDVEAFKKNFDIICSEMENATENRDLLYRNTLHCNCWGRRCEYFPVCSHYDPDCEYVGFTKEERL